MSPNTPVILLIEDSEDDVFFVRYSLRKAGVPHQLQHVTNGHQAIDYLLGNTKYADRLAYPFPNIVFLDLKLPLFSGFDILKSIRSHAELAGLPVVVLTGSSEERDRERARELGAQDYFVKPPDPDMIKNVMSSITASDAPPASQSRETQGEASGQMGRPLTGPPPM